jgi:hypothetical protein
VLITFYIVHYALNSIQNLGELGAPVPSSVLELLTTLKYEKKTPINFPKQKTHVRRSQRANREFRSNPNYRGRPPDSNRKR